MTAEDINRAEVFLSSVNVGQLLHAREDLKRVFEKYGKSLHSQRTYGARLDQFLDWARSQDWWPEGRRFRLQNQCCPSRPVSGIRHMRDIKLTRRQGAYTQYRLRPEEMSDSLKLAIAQYRTYLTAASCPERVRDKVSENTANNYLQNLLLMLGFLYHHESISREELSLEHLIPVIQLEDIDHLTPLEQKKIWRKVATALKAWLSSFFTFTQEENQSISPRTRVGRLNALEALAFYLYRNEVQEAGEYHSIPIFVVLKDLINQQVREVKRWQQAKRKVSDQSMKWPDPVEGETALETLQRNLVEPLRLMCRPRYQKGILRPPKTMAIALQKFLKWALMTTIPPRRQQDHRTLKISLCCDVKRPDYVPADGVYFPVPPAQLREQDVDGLVSDNYIARVYVFHGKPYPQGVWVLFLEGYKTDDSYGSFSIMIPNVPYKNDGTCLYDYFDAYFCGRWVASGTQRSHPYVWWDHSLLGQQGEWIAPGLLAFDSKEEWPHEVPWRWQYAFVLPNTGKLGNETSYAGSFMRTAKQYLKKSTSPHTMRYIWATWGFQKRLNEMQMRSLAYAMGHSLEMLRDMYESVSQPEKLRAISEVINAELLESFESAGIEPFGLPEDVVVAYLKRLSPEERQRLWNLAS